MKTASSLTKFCSFIFILFALTACQTMHGLSHKQVKVLKAQGFVQTEEGWTLRLPERLLFDSNESTLNETRQSNLIQLGQQLKKVNIINFKVNGHTDNTGAEDYNLELSKKRADSVAAPLILSGIPAINIKTTGMGDRQPIASNDTVEGRASNRRVTIIVIP